MADRTGGEQHERAIGDQHQADRQLEGAQADIGEKEYADGHADQPGEQRRR